MWNKIDPKTMNKNVFSMIGDQWMLITAGTVERCNTMTASWGGMGVLWGKNVAMAFIRPQRYTFEFVEKNDWFTLSFLEERYRKQLALCGAKSGRDTDKVKECNFTVKTGESGAPYFDEAELVLVCRKLYWQDFDRTHFLDASIENNYPNHDYHRMYVGEIVEALKKG
ncbi:MAG: flavin reductase family protein [Intestinimonas sp.]|jgi:flavin reductase (DIM6/NTAB) family NADH-FMN oxidoreductase RutF|nr:flavin reductase family protein [Intestinimonas sp.]